MQNAEHLMPDIARGAHDRDLVCHADPPDALRMPLFYRVGRRTGQSSYVRRFKSAHAARGAYRSTSEW
jgi:hypothetical protein